MQHATLVVMAAGMGSRYGGNKQVDGVGPHGEILMNYGIYDAARAGFDKVVFVIKPEIRDLIHRRANAVLRWTGLDEKLANSVLDGLYKLLAEVIVDPRHPLRGKIEEGLAKLSHDLQHDPQLRTRVERLKGELDKDLTGHPVPDIEAALQKA